MTAATYGANDMDLGLLLLRLLLATVLYFHATQKLFGWFRGPGLTASARFFEDLGQRPGRPLALVAAGAELAGAALVGLGIVTPLGAAIVVGTMTVAGLSTTLVKGTPWNAQGGGEYPLVLAAVAAVLAFTGPGSWSLDAALHVPWMQLEDSTAAAVGGGTLVLAGVAALVPTLRARLVLAGRRKRS
jgi:putative oxidoreductase